VTVLVVEVELLLLVPVQEATRYPLAGVAVSVTTTPASYVPLVGVIVPLPADTVALSWYWVDGNEAETWLEYPLSRPSLSYAVTTK
jgi:hypothetical protein